jgi:hypothetical protein
MLLGTEFVFLFLFFFSVSRVLVVPVDRILFIPHVLMTTDMYCIFSLVWVSRWPPAHPNHLTVAFWAGEWSCTYPSHLPALDGGERLPTHLSHLTFAQGGGECSHT